MVITPLDMHDHVSWTMPYTGSYKVADAARKTCKWHAIAWIAIAAYDADGNSRIWEDMRGTRWRNDCNPESGIDDTCKLGQSTVGIIHLKEGAAVSQLRCQKA